MPWTARAGNTLAWRRAMQLRSCQMGQCLRLPIQSPFQFIVSSLAICAANSQKMTVSSSVTKPAAHG